ncbi:hypothetical protein BaRGS_00033898 [Batillaria attramentaria]|uniref:Uncharacterized protein n=1 Tax=Batillaria attramentaria TaxID=370345 RepID=A0ABD0JJK0_9CAEN
MPHGRPLVPYQRHLGHSALRADAAPHSDRQQAGGRADSHSSAVFTTLSTARQRHATDTRLYRATVNSFFTLHPGIGGTTILATLLECQAKHHQISLPICKSPLYPIRRCSSGPLLKRQTHTQTPPKDFEE